ncbi:MAG: DUF4292 domain-containing protein [Bacteroidia bacterium]
MKSNIWLLFIGVALTFQSCELLKRSGNLDSTKLKSLKQFEKLYTQNLAQSNYKWFKASGRVKIKSASQNVSLTAQFKSRKDSLVWARLSKLLEVVRAQANTEHFQLINRLERTYLEYNFSELSAIIDPSQGLAAFQNILLGNIPFSVSQSNFAVGSNAYTLTQQSDSIKQTAVIDKKMLKVSSYIIESTDGKTQAQLSLSNYVNTDYGYVPQKLIVKIKGAELEAVEIDFSKIEFSNKDKVDFSIPDSYNEN